MGEKHICWCYQDVLATVLKTRSKAAHINAIASAIIKHAFNRTELSRALDKHGAPNITYYKLDLLDLLLDYANIILDDHAISEKEYHDFGLLKILFKIKEGDFYRFRYKQIEQVVHSHLAYILQDGTISLEGAMTSVDLQSMFSLSEDQYEEFEASFKASQ